MDSHIKKTKRKSKDDIKIEKEALKESSSVVTEIKGDSNSDSVVIEKTGKKERTKQIDIEDQLAALNEKYLRLLAEYDNHRKRSTREKEMLYQTATGDLIKEILPILDSLDRATEHRDNKTTIEEYVKWIDLIEDQLRDVLARAGLKHIEVIGKPFDPNIHDAVMQVESDEYEPNIVTSEVQKGYMVSDMVIRHSKVIVSK